MKYQVLNVGEPIELIEVVNHEKVPDFFGNRDLGTIENKRIYMEVFTDGTLISEIPLQERKIDKYTINGKDYGYSVDTLRIKKLYLKDYSYVITYLIAKEWTRVENIVGWFDIVKNVSVYVKEPKDKVGLKNAKQAIKEIKNHNNGINYSSLIAMLCSQGQKLEKFESETLLDNVHCLRRKLNK